MRDIVERLKILSEFRTIAPATTLEAADEIERLRSQIERYRSLIIEWADAEDYDDSQSEEAYYSARQNLRKTVGRLS